MESEKLKYIDDYLKYRNRTEPNAEDVDVFGRLSTPSVELSNENNNVKSNEKVMTLSKTKEGLPKMYEEPVIRKAA